MRLRSSCPARSRGTFGGQKAGHPYPPLGRKGALLESEGHQSRNKTAGFPSAHKSAPSQQRNRAAEAGTNDVVHLRAGSSRWGGHLMAGNRQNRAKLTNSPKPEEIPACPQRCRRLRDLGAWGTRVGFEVLPLERLKELPKVDKQSWVLLGFWHDGYGAASEDQTLAQQHATHVVVAPNLRDFYQLAGRVAAA